MTHVDIFWVFGTEVMVSVAKNVKGPLLLLFPRKFADLMAETKGEFSMLGLGDIVIPGLFIALLLRLDTVKYLRSLISAHAAVTASATAATSTTVDAATATATASDAAQTVKPAGAEGGVLLPMLEDIQGCAYSTPYFTATLISYVLGLLMTVFVMYYFNAAQPALLYLVPCCLLSSYGTSLSLGEFKTVFWVYNEEAPEAKEGKVEGEASTETAEESKNK